MEKMACRKLTSTRAVRQWIRSAHWGRNRATKQQPDLGLPLWRRESCSVHDVSFPLSENEPAPQDRRLRANTG